VSELEEIQKRWPLFEISTHYNEYAKKNTFTAVLNPDRGGTHKYHFWELSKKTVESLNLEHARLEKRQSLEKKFPNLVIYISQDWLLRPEVLWVKRNGRDAEAMVSSSKGFTDEELAIWSMKATKALEKDYFFCAGHDEFEPRSNYAYYYFAGSYCKRWKEEHPGHYNRAKNENYN
jgi:hypothetical protein